MIPFIDLQAQRLRLNGRIEAAATIDKVIAGEALGARSPLQTRTPAMCLDVTMRPGARLRQPVQDGWSTCAYILDGAVASFGGQ